MRAYVWILAAWSSIGFARTSAQSFMPPNDLSRFDQISKNANIDQGTFNTIIDRVMSFYTEIATTHGATLTVDKNWSDSTVNAFAQQSGNAWKISMFGGLARRDEVTPDGFALVVCHELGHHFAGFPFYGAGEWAAAEGQSDYFATHVCAKRIWANDAEENGRYRTITPETVRNKCDAIYAATADQDLCYRSAMGGHSLARLLAALGSRPEPAFDTPDQTQVRTTSVAHPQAQCRLDTYVQGALCPVAWNNAEIPARSHPEGQQSIGAERVASALSCTAANRYSVGIRPRCWFSPRLSLTIDSEHIQLSEIAGNGNPTWEPGETFGIQVPLLNTLLAPVTDAALMISTTSPEVSISRASALYPEIPAGGSAQTTEPVSVEVSGSLECGTIFNVEAKVTVDTWSDALNIPFLLGALQEVENQAIEPQLAIPDNNPQGLSSAVSARAEGTAHRAKVSVDISHSYIGDLVIKLQSPTGKEFVLHDRAGGATHNLRKEFEITLGQEPIIGEWRLKVADLAAIDTGTLNSWGMSFLSPHCDSDHPQITRL